MKAGRVENSEFSTFSNAIVVANARREFRGNLSRSDASYQVGRRRKANFAICFRSRRRENVTRSARKAHYLRENDDDCIVCWRVDFDS